MKNCSVQENRERDYFISTTDAAAVLDACPDAQWRLLFALSRFGGLRCPSEHLGLRWGDVHFGDGSEADPGKITVHCPKTEHHKNKGVRVVPMFPELRPDLEDVYAIAKDDSEDGKVAPSGWVVMRYRQKNSNLRTQLERIIKKAGIEPWPKLFQNLCAMRATELVAAGWSEFKVCEWIGHTEAIAKKHYWQVTDDDYAKAAAMPEVPKTGLHSGLHFPGATPCNAVA